MEEVDAYIYGKRIGTMLEHKGSIYFEYDAQFKLLGLEISPIKLHTTKILKPYSNPEHTDLYHGMAGVFLILFPINTVWHS